jgi:hypothetical protein
MDFSRDEQMSDQEQTQAYSSDHSSGSSSDSAGASAAGAHPEKREATRVKVKVPVELYIPNSDVPHRGATSDLSVTGCYIESIFPFPIGTVFEMKLHVDETVLALGKVVTCDPQVGNGIKFTKILPEDQEQLRAHIEAAQQAQDQT